MDRSATAAGDMRWWQLIIGIICMAMVANLQYGWTLFVNPIHDKFGWSKAAIQVAFTLFVLLETWLVPFEGWFVDRFGPRLMIFAGGLLALLAWVLDSMATTLPMLYLAGAVGGIGAGAVYGTCIGNALKWFSDRRGLAAGLTAAGFGAGSALTIIPIREMIHTSGYEHTFLVFAFIQGVTVMVLSWFFRAPVHAPPRATPSREIVQTRVDAAPIDALRSPIFWVMYVMFILVAAGGLMAVAQLAPIAHDFNIANVPVTLIGITLPAITFGLSIDRILNGLTRPLTGWVSDHLGRANTMFGAFALEALGIWLLGAYGHNPVAFVLLSGTVFLFWGEIFSLFPATIGDVFGARYATTNAGLMYTAKGCASLLVPFGNVLKATTGSWHAVFVIAVAANIVASLLAIFVLKPMIQSRISKAPVAADTAAHAV